VKTQNTKPQNTHPQNEEEKMKHRIITVAATTTKQTFLTAILLFTILSLYAQTTYTVGDTDQHPDADFTSITSAINAAVSGDTIIVYPGRYNSINFSGKDVYITSQYRYTGNRDDIDNTVIDGQWSGSAVMFASDETRDAVLNGFTIENGVGQPINVFGDIHTEGGGICIRAASPTILNCVIQNNTASQGGGIHVRGIFNGSVDLPCSPYLAGNIIKNNTAYGQAGGLRIGGSYRGFVFPGAEVVFDTTDKNSIFHNIAPDYKDIYSNSPTPLNIVLDAFTVDTYDTSYIGVTEAAFTFSCEQGMIEQIDQDIYVSVTGDDSNSGLTPESPMKTIKEAVARVKANPDSRNTIHIAPGVYKASEGQLFPIRIKANVALQGAWQGETILDREGGTGVIYSDAGAENFKISGITFINNWWPGGLMVLPHGVANPYLGDTAPIVLWGTDNCEISDCHFENNLGGIQTVNYNRVPVGTAYCTNLSFVDNYNGVIELAIGNAVFENIKILQNHFDSFWQETMGGTPFVLGAIQSARANYTLSNILIAGTSYDGEPTVFDNFGASAMTLFGSINVLINNATIVNNHFPDFGSPFGAPYVMRFDCFALDSPCVVKIVNSIITSGEDKLIVGQYGIADIEYSLVEGGADNVLCQLVWGEGNIDAYPNFDAGYAGEEEFPYQLLPSSPCIDAGTVDIADYTWSAYDLLGNHRINFESVDMGAYEYNGNIAMYVDFAGAPRIGEVPLTVQFTDTSVGYEVNSWQWDFDNDGVFDSTEQNPVFTYETPAISTVRLVINGGQASRVKPDYVNALSIYGSLEGHVMISSGFVFGALVTILGTDFEAVTNGTGFYSFAELPPGVYSIRVEKEGLNTYTADNIVVAVRETTYHFVLMSPSSESGDVTVPVATALGGNYPNPFNPSTTISFSLERSGDVVIDVYNVRGQRVRSLVSGVYEAGVHNVVWDGVSDDGAGVGSGVYFYRMVTGGYSSVRKMLLLK